MNNETKSVSQVVLRDNILRQIKHAELYKAFKDVLKTEYNNQKEAFFKEKWIAFSLNGKKAAGIKNCRSLFRYSLFTVHLKNHTLESDAPHRRKIQLSDYSTAEVNVLLRSCWE